MMEEKDKIMIVAALEQRVGKLECPICHQSKYTFLDGYFIDVVQEDYKTVKLGGRMLPMVVLVCNQCGHIDKFSLGVLGFLESNEELKKPSSD